VQGSRRPLGGSSNRKLEVSARIPSSIRFRLAGENVPVAAKEVLPGGPIPTQVALQAI
jgi:hypothetical protein